MFSCNRHETRLLMENHLAGVVRRYSKDVGCPHVPGAQMVFTSRYMRGFEGQDVVVAKGRCVSVRPGTVGEFRKNDSIAHMDGFDNGVSWHTYFTTQMYKGIRDTEPVFHIQVKIDAIEKNPRPGAE